MRVSSLSDERVIGLLSRYFIPVWLSRDSYQLSPRTRAEKDELLRIDREREKRGLEGGTVCVYILGRDGALLDTMRVQRASKPENLVPFLRALVEREKLPPRRPEAVRASAVTSRTPVRPATEGGLVLHVRTGFEERRTDYGLSEDWVPFTPEECATFLPAARVGAWRRVPDRVADRLFLTFYPPGPNWRVKDSTILSRSLTAKVVSVTDREVRVALHGELELSHPFGTGKEGRVRARLVGVLRYEPSRREIVSFLMVSEEAKYAWQWKGKPQPEKMVIAIEKEPTHRGNTP